ncbi:MAG: 4-hydroxy-tetrahydrodipicolinate reductase [Tissierellia bacterium]|nr:4-hydroxy-tetrahydrodipicolinate reductase [Tissierellia bacterium]
MKILLSGATGQMGKTITEMVSDSNHEIVAGFAKEPSNIYDYPVYSNLNIEEDVDIIIDFSSPHALNELLDFAEKKGIGIVLASTGYSDSDIEKIKSASNKIPIVFSGNLSVGINVMQMIAEKLSSLLKGFDIEIVEKHHRYKADSPSGTAKMLFDSVNKGRDNSLFKLEGRSGFYDERKENEVGISSIRGGNIVGEHSVLFCGTDEIIEIKHIASSKKIFANGSIQAAEFLLDKESGLYDMNNVLMEV